MRKIYDKLVRDKIEEILTAKGLTFGMQVLDDADVLPAFREKLKEEVMEYVSAKDPHSQLQELADILEVVDALAAKSGYTFKDVLDTKQMKKTERGGFEKKLFLQFVDEPDEV